MGELRVLAPGKSMFGSQVCSGRETAPAYGFGSSVRDSTTKMFLSREQVAQYVGKVGPGPIYDVPSSVGAQHSSRKNTAPAYKFGSRATSDYNLAKEGRPGPGEYGIGPMSVGPQFLSKKENSTSWKFGSGNRWSSYKDTRKEFDATPGMGLPALPSGWLGDAAMFSFHGGSKRYEIGVGIPGALPSFRAAPGPGSYATISCLGQQFMSNKESASRTKFGTSSRQQQEKVYITAEHERAMIGMHSPAPNTYDAKSSIGQQWLSRNPNAQCFKFGTADRFSEIRNKDGVSLQPTPGPGSYGV
mmetsp:Transcript_15827/g.38529  ORF Transcript_15827/g.38529 Transcript_15827/m.38529 type:complete len:301 (-) Transcript_15827:345-1247(-)